MWKTNYLTPSLDASTWSAGRVREVLTLDPRGLRNQSWPNEAGRHPRNRWTGRDLARDAHEADQHLAEGFEEFYRLRYPRLCWLVHGSGTLGLANMSFESIAYTAGEAAAGAARFARVVAQVVATHMGCLDEESFRSLPEQVKEARAMAYAAALGIRA